jgi:hypothetical protein
MILVRQADDGIVARGSAIALIAVN